MRVVAELLTRQIARSKGISDLGLPEATQIMETGTMLMSGKPVSVDDELRASIEPLCREIQETANQVLGSGTLRRMHGLLIAGGGAPLLFSHLAKTWPQAVLSDEPRFSVAEGFMRAGLLRENTTAEELASR
jgi:plasmid segregation protein ParM